MNPSEEITLAHIRDAAARIAPHVHATPVLRSRSLDALAGCELHFKAEHTQRVGAFKFRGAANAVFSLDEARAARGVLTQSSGNHGAAIALACRLRGIPATVVVPNTAPAVKLAAIEGYGARIVLCEPTMQSRDEVTAKLLAQSGAEVIHPFDDPRVIAGQGTVALELLHQAPLLDAILAPVSGGGLLSGIAIAARALAPSIEILGAEPSGAADAHDSLIEGRRIAGRTADTICDGLRGQLSERTFALIRAHADGILLAGDDEVREAMRWLFSRMKQVIEPSGAMGLAAVLKHRERFAGKRVGIVLTGGNVDLSALFPRAAG